MSGSGRRDPVDVKRPSDVEGPIADGEPGQIGPVTNRPTVSVIITNHNYGHFLEASLDSVFGQSHRAGEIIVVDDHSTDLSARVLSRHRGAINVIQASARGQAAAFNLGFRHATCEVVAFLDADDMLNPDALETALDYWSEDLAVLSFGLGTIDASGRSTGLHPYSLAADNGDNRPRLIRSRSVSGPFLFAPTSGNLFSRAFLQAALPMPEVEWRICADAYVVRAAAIWGRSRAIARALGQYRVHGANNYTRPDTFDPWAMQRSLRDVENSARALEALADWDGAPETGSDRDALRVALRLRALETRANAAAWTGDRAAFRAHVATAVKATLSAPALPFAERMAAAGAMFRFARRAPLKRPVDPSLEEAKVYPLPLPRLPGAAALTRRLRNLERPRWCQPLRFGVTHDFTDHGPHRNALAEGWCGRRWDGACESFGAEAALEFTLEPADHQVTVELVLAAPPGWERDDLGVSITASGERAWVGALPSDGTETMIRFTLARDPFAPHDPQRVEIGCHRLVPRRRLSLSRSRAPYFRLVSLRLEEAQRDEAKVWPVTLGKRQASTRNEPVATDFDPLRIERSIRVTFEREPDRRFCPIARERADPSPLAAGVDRNAELLAFRSRRRGEHEFSGHMALRRLKRELQRRFGAVAFAGPVPSPSAPAFGERVPMWAVFDEVMGDAEAQRLRPPRPLEIAQTAAERGRPWHPRQRQGVDLRLLMRWIRRALERRAIPETEHRPGGGHPLRERQGRGRQRRLDGPCHMRPEDLFLPCPRGGIGTRLERPKPERDAQRVPVGSRLWRTVPFRQCLQRLGGVFDVAQAALHGPGIERVGSRVVVGAVHPIAPEDARDRPRPTPKRRCADEVGVGADSPIRLGHGQGRLEKGAGEQVAGRRREKERPLTERLRIRRGRLSPSSAASEYGCSPVLRPEASIVPSPNESIAKSWLQ